MVRVSFQQPLQLFFAAGKVVSLVAGHGSLILGKIAMFFKLLDRFLGALLPLLRHVLDRGIRKLDAGATGRQNQRQGDAAADGHADWHP